MDFNHGERKQKRVKTIARHNHTTYLIPIFLQVFITRQAISPRFAIKILSNNCCMVQAAGWRRSKNRSPPNRPWVGPKLFSKQICVKALLDVRVFVPETYSSAAAATHTHHRKALGLQKHQQTRRSHCRARKPCDSTRSITTQHGVIISDSKKPNEKYDSCQKPKSRSRGF